MTLYKRISSGFLLLSITFVVGCSSSTKKNEVTSQLETPVFRFLPSSSTGVTFNNHVDENINNYFDFFAYVYNGGGVGIGDINNDGLPDIFFTGNEVPNKLYLNQGNLKFKDITESAGVAGNGRWNNGVTMVDINGDGLLDIYVTKGGYHDPESQRKNLLFVNQGDLTFKEQANDYGIDDSGYSIHASFFDMDNDNDLDLYVTNRPDTFDLTLTEMVRQRILSPTGTRDKLYRNDNGKYKEIGLQAGIKNNFGYALSLVTSDINNDGYTDIFIANDFAEGDYLYINQGNGTFKEQIKETTNHISMYSMGTDVADINNDGLEDIFVSEMLPEDYKRSKVSMPSMDVQGFYNIVNGGMHKQYMHNALHLNQGNNFFSEISQLSGVAKTEWSWACLLSDFNNDGLRDIFVANGYKRDVFDGDLDKKLTSFVIANRNKYNSPEEMLSKGFKDFISIYDTIKVKNYLFKNTGNLQFENVIDAWGFNEPSFSNGAAVGDLDNDGDLELVINNLDDEAFIYENLSSTTTNYLKVKLVGPKGNADGIGAKVTVHYNNQKQYFENKVVRGYLSSNDPIVHFGLGSNNFIDSIQVKWNDGMQGIVKEKEVNRVVTINYNQAIKTVKTVRPNTLFQASQSILTKEFQHQENEFNEFKEQVLLPHRFSKSGPFISVADINNDGTEDFFIGGASGQAGAIYVQQNGKLNYKSTPAFEADKKLEDMGSTFFDVDGDGDLDLYVVSGGSEFPQGTIQYKDRIYVNDGKGNFSKGDVINTISSGSCVLAFDFDEDGDLDIFRGGQVVQNNYPKSPKSYLLINEKAKFIDQTKTLTPQLEEIGMVNSAIWVDLDGDKKSELVIVGEWMPVTVFSNRDGLFKDVTSDFGLDKTEGWWNTIVADDLDGDGDMDLIGGNLGENYKFTAKEDKPFQVYAKDFDNNGTNDIFLAKFYNDSLLVPIRGRECTSQQMPVIAQKFPTYRSFAQSDLRGILGNDIKTAIRKRAYLFSSAVFINNGALGPDGQGKFAIQKLPVEAQLSVSNGIIINDFDGDGIKDFLIAGNKFDTEVETTPADGSPGVFLKGLGNLKFKSLKSTESGFFVPYNVKDLKMIKGQNGWIILVSTNNDKLRVFTVGASASRPLALNK